MNLAEASAATPEQRIRQMVGGFWISRCLFAAAKLGLADHLANGGRSAGEVAAAIGTNEQATFRLMRALAGVGLLRSGNERFELTPLGDCLRSDAPGSMRWLILAELGDDRYEAWGEIVESLTTGEPAFEKHFGMPL